VGRRLGEAQTIHGIGQLGVNVFQPGANSFYSDPNFPDPNYPTGYSLNPGTSVPSQDQAARDPVKILAWGAKSGSSSREPAGMKTKSSFSRKRGILEPQVRQKVLVNRSASGNLKLVN
jgi:hypothetical protein